MNQITIFDSKGEHVRPLVITHITKAGEPVSPPKFRYLSNAQDMQQLPRFGGNGQAHPEGAPVSYDGFSQAFRAYGRERDKELNRKFPQFYAPKSWFSAANADKRGLKLADKCERVELLLKRGKITPEEAAKRRANLEAATISEVQAAHELVEAQNLAAREAKRMRRNAPSRTGKATPQSSEPTALKVDPAGYLPTALGVWVNGELVGMEACGVHNEGVPHYGVSNGMEGRGPRHGDAHIYAPLTKREEKALELADLGIRLNKAKAEALALAGKEGGRAAHKRARSLQHAFDRLEYEFKTGGVMGRMHAQNAHATGKSSRQQRAAEKVKEEKARH